MRSIPILLFAALTLSLASCAKVADDVARDVGLLPSGCGSEGARLQATVGPVEYCADMQLTAMGDGTSVIVTGIDLVGNTLVLQFDDLEVGVHAITSAANGVLYMQTGMTYVVAPGTNGSLQVMEHDAEAGRLKATFTVELFNEMSGNTRQVSGEVEVTYSVGE